MRASRKLSLELSASELRGIAAAPADAVELEDMRSVEPLPPAATRAVSRPGSSAAPAQDADEDSVEIELTAEQMEALLSGADPAL